jgi:hypothetical protein
MQYREIINEKGERLWIPLLAGAAILSAPFWLNNNKCCNNYYPTPVPYQYPYPIYQSNYYPYPYPYPYQQPYSTYPFVQNINTK